MDPARTPGAHRGAGIPCAHRALARFAMLLTVAGVTGTAGMALADAADTMHLTDEPDQRRHLDL